MRQFVRLHNASQHPHTKPVHMPQKSIRFAVRDGDLRGGTWKLWTDTGASEVYLACRSLGGTLKTSLHASGNWHVAFTQKAFEEQIEGAIPSASDRFIEKWMRPPEVCPGTTLAYRVVVPSGAVTSPLSVLDGKVSWVPNPPLGEATEIDIFLVRGGLRPGTWPGQRSMGTSLIGSFTLENGSTVFAVSHVIAMPETGIPPVGKATLAKGIKRSDVEQATLRGVAFGKEPDGSRTIYDLAGRLVSDKESEE